ncbi:MAG: hypothetical protein AAGF24_14330, partial [Cyanobacteria bacterium P01_H01_bin.121]
LSEAIPSALTSLCTVQQRILWCQNVDTGATEPGEYRFQLTVIPKGRPPKEPITKTLDSVVVIEAPPASPVPQIVSFEPVQANYQEVLPAAATAIAIPPLTLPPSTGTPVVIKSSAADQVVTAASLAEQTMLTGLVESNGRWDALIRLPQATNSQLFTVGQSLADGTMRLKRVEPAAEPAFIVLEENGQEYIRTLGAAALPAPKQQKAPAVPQYAALPSIPGLEPVELKIAPAVIFTGLVEAAGSPQAVLQLPGEQNVQTVVAGDRLVGGRLLVKQINASAAVPSIVLVEQGIEVVKALGELPPKTQTSTTVPLSQTGSAVTLPVPGAASSSQSGATTSNTAQSARVLQAPGVLLNWTLSQPGAIASLTLTGRAANGTVVGQIRKFDLTQGLPAELQPYCAILQTMLQCRQVPTFVTQAGTFTFELAVQPRSDRAQATITQKTDPVEVKALLPVIAEFLVNGEVAKANYLLPFRTDQAMPPLVLAWKVIAPPGTTVSLLPTPGTVAAAGSTIVPLAPEAGITSITLQAKNASGEIVTRSLKVKTYAEPVPATSTTPQAATTTQSETTSSTESGSSTQSEADNATASGQ